MFHTQQPDPSSLMKRLVLNANHSTGQLIPACRAQILKAKRENLRRKINQVANQIFNLKYDTEHETQQLHKLTEKGQQLFQIAEANRQKVKAELQQAVKPISLESQIMSINLQEIKSNKCQNSDRSTHVSALTDRKQQSLESSCQVTIDLTAKLNQSRKHQRYDVSECKVKPLDLRKLSMSQRLSLVQKNMARSSEGFQRNNLKVELIKQMPVESIIIILLGLTIIILLI